MLLWILQLRCQLLNLVLLIVKLYLKLIDLGCQIGHVWDLLSDNLELPLPLLEFQIVHSNLFFFLSNSLLASLENVLINVRLFVKNTQFIVLVNELNTLIVSRLASHLVFEDERVHLLLQRVNNEIEFVTFINFLTNDAHLVLVKELFLVQLSPVVISQLGFNLNILFPIGEHAIFLT